MLSRVVEMIDAAEIMLMSLSLVTGLAIWSFGQNSALAEGLRWSANAGTQGK